MIHRVITIITSFCHKTFVVDALRTTMLANSTSVFGLTADYAILIRTTTVLVFIGARLYPRLGV